MSVETKNAAAREPWLRRLRHNPALPVYVITLLVFGGALLTSESFRSPYNLNNVIIQMVALGVAALGQSFAILAGDVDLCVGGVLSLATVLCATLMKDSLSSMLAVSALCVASGLLIGVINGVLTTVIKLDAMVTTFASNSMLMGFALWILPSPGGEIPYEYMAWIDITLWQVPLPLILLLVLLLASHFILDKTVLGFHIRAVGGGPRSAFTSGVSLLKVKIEAHAIAGLMASLAGLFLAARMGSGDALAGVPFSMDSMTAVIAGGAAFSTGVGSVMGSTAAAFLITVLGNAFNHWGVSTYWQYVFKGLLLVIAVTGSAFRIRLAMRRRVKKERDGR